MMYREISNKKACPTKGMVVGCLYMCVNLGKRGAESNLFIQWGPMRNSIFVKIGMKKTHRFDQSPIIATIIPPFPIISAEVVC